MLRNLGTALRTIEQARAVEATIDKIAHAFLPGAARKHQECEEEPRSHYRGTVECSKVPVNVRFGPNAALTQLNHHLISRHTRARRDMHLSDHAITLGADDVLHLHGFDDGDALAAFHFLAGFCVDRDHKPRHR